MDLNHNHQLNDSLITKPLQQACLCHRRHRLKVLELFYAFD